MSKRWNVPLLLSLPVSVKSLAIAWMMPMVLDGGAFAQSSGPECAKIQGSELRLACYDGLFRASQTSSTKGGWIISEEISKISDVKNVTLSLESSDQLTGRYGAKKRAQLVLVCREGKTNAYIIFGGHFMSSLNNGTVTYRVDKKPAVRKPMLESNDHQALGLWGGASSIPFIRELFGGSSLYVQATPHSESAVTTDFNIAGLAEAIKPLQSACNWQSKQEATQAKPRKNGL